MLMHITVTEARKDMSRFFDAVIREHAAVVVTRGRREGIWAIDRAKIPDVLRAYRFTMEYETDGERFYGSLKQIPDIVGEGAAVAELRSNLADYLLQYSLGYAEELQLFYNAPNRRSHYPYVLHVLAQDDLAGVAGLID